LGSVGLFRVYVKMLAIRLGLAKDRYDENGVNSEFNVDPIDRQSGKQKRIEIDEVSVTEYKHLLETARARGAKIIGFVPPIYATRYEAEKSDYDAYFERMATLFRAGEKLVDFNAPAYARYTREPTNFYDGVHLTQEAANFFASELAVAVSSSASASLSR
jgi:lysophospholipase L1-like esterase